MFTYLYADINCYYNLVAMHMDRKLCDTKMGNS